MEIAFDVDDTITKNPSLFREFMLSLRTMGAIVYILTGNDGSMPRSKRLKQLKKIGIVNCYDELLIAEGRNVAEVAREKAEICSERQIDIFIDDTELYCQAVREQNPNTIILKVF